MGPKKRTNINNPKAGTLRKRNISNASIEPPTGEGSSKAKIPKETESFDNFIQRIKNQRVEVASSIENFNFIKNRCRTLTDVERLPEHHKGVLYWMSRDQRVEDNWALLYAQKLALKENAPLYVCFCLVPQFLQATLRQYAFMLKGFSKVHKELKDLKIPFYLLRGEAHSVLPKFVQEKNIGGVVTDFSPLRIPCQWANSLTKSLQETEIPLCQVDAHNIVPVWIASDKQEHMARTIRPKITDKLSQYLTEFPPMVKHPYNKDILDSEFVNPFEDISGLLKGLKIDTKVKEVNWAQPGTIEGLKMLHSFIQERLIKFSSSRNDPNENSLSNLSPWFHFGQLSVARAILEVKKVKETKYQESIKSFIEEAVIRRELSDNFCFYNPDGYDKVEGALQWAQKTLKDHQKDKRSPTYSLNKLEYAKTSDDLWNGAQLQLLIEGKMHGFLRMYWAKKILEWTESPEKALEIAIFLNDKYNLDGRDPNGYVGCMWSICGVHDQGWKERSVFGKIRYMNYAGCQRKFDVKTFEDKYKTLARQEGLA